MRIPCRDITEWEQLQAEFEEKRTSGLHWVFRGLRDAKYQMKTTLERCREFYRIPVEDLYSYEGGLIRKFKRHYHHHSADAPEDGDYLEWLSIMRHHGAPTRLLDWTYSLYVALFFALEESTVPAAIWALNTSALDADLKNKFKDIYDSLESARNLRTPEQYKKSLGLKPAKQFVAPVNPYRLNQRLTVQQGTFLAQGDIKTSFEANLEAVIGPNPPESVVVQLIIDDTWDFRKALQQRLYRMNINNAALFPGLDGFARSLQHMLHFPKEMLPPDRDYL